MMLEIIDFQIININSGKGYVLLIVRHFSKTKIVFFSKPTFWNYTLHLYMFTFLFHRHVIGDIFIPLHLYGQLSQHDEGFKLLLQNTNHLQSPLQAVQEMDISDEQHVAQLKAALWALV